jgi:antitoxin ParD1/3/4
MGKHATIDLDDELSAFVEEQVGQGRYESTSAVVAAALRLLEDEQKLEKLRAALIEGEESGFPDEDFNFDDFLEEMHKSQ